MQSPFVSAYRVYTILPLIPFDKYRNLDKITKVTAPVLVIEAGNDSIIPTWHTRSIYDAVKTDKEWYSVDGADHNDLFTVAGEDYWKHILAFTHNLPKNINNPYIQLYLIKNKSCD